MPCHQMHSGRFRLQLRSFGQHLTSLLCVTQRIARVCVTHQHTQIVRAHLHELFIHFPCTRIGPLGHQGPPRKPLSFKQPGIKRCRLLRIRKRQGRQRLPQHDLPHEQIRACITWIIRKHTGCLSITLVDLSARHVYPGQSKPYIMATRAIL